MQQDRPSFREQVTVEVVSAVLGVAVAYVSAKLYGILRDEDDPVKAWWNKAKAAYADGMQAYHEAEVAAKLYTDTMDRARQILREAGERHERGERVDDEP